MEVLYACCCGIDVHAKMLVACLLKQGKKEVCTFSTMTEDLLRLLDWLTQEGCTHVAIQSTGVYGRPVLNILEGVMEVILTNARDAKGYTARKTDVIDAEWLADLLRHGLLKPSFIPPLPIRELRDLTRYRESLVRERTTGPRSCKPPGPRAIKRGRTWPRSTNAWGNGWARRKRWSPWATVFW